MEAGEQDEVTYFTSSHATPGTRGEVQSPIAWPISTHINKKLMFASFVCFDEADFRFNVVVAGTTSV